MNNGLRASLARFSMTRSQFGAFFIGAMPVWRVLLTKSLILYAILFLPVWRELLWRVSFLCMFPLCVVLSASYIY